MFKIKPSNKDFIQLKNQLNQIQGFLMQYSKGVNLDYHKSFKEFKKLVKKVNSEKCI